MSGLFVTGVTSHNATLRWEGTPRSIGYQYVVTKSYTPPEKFGLFTTELYHTETTLAANTTYYAHVRTSCPGANTSGWVTVQFNTPDPNENNMGLTVPFAVMSYPLEADRSVTLKIKGGDVGAGDVTILDILGRVVRTYELKGDRIHMEVSGLPANIYLIRYNDVYGRIQTMRFTKR